jgi:stearoyl-CoA desaturase (delta-9 desaturase)
VTVTIDERRPDEQITWQSELVFLGVQMLPLLAVFTGITAKAIALCVVLYIARMFLVTAVYHRYFSHKTFRMSRPVQFVMAFAATTAAQKGPLWWAAHHRAHHRFSDTPDDLHSPRKGFWFSHIGWVLAQRSKATDIDRIQDFAKYPELRFLDRYDWIGPWMLGTFAFFYAGLPGLFIGFFGSTVLLWHGTYTVNSLTHVWGSRRYATDDTSRNNALIALFTGGEGWHNNHHHYPASVRQGFFWWEYDFTYYVLKAMSWVGLVRDLRVPTKKVKLAGWVKNGTFDRGVYRASIDRAAALNRLVAAKTSDPDALVASVGVDDALDEAREAGRRLALVGRTGSTAGTPATLAD